MKKVILLICLAFCFTIQPSFAQKKKKKNGKTETPAPPKPKAKKGKKISDFIKKDAKTSDGIFKSHIQGAKLYFEIPNNQLEKEFLVVSRIAKTPGIQYGGTKVHTAVVRWQKKYDKILLRSVSYQNVANDSMPIYQAVKNSNFEPIIKSFDIKAYNNDSSNVLIDVTSLYVGDVHPFSIPSFFRKFYQIKRLDKTRSFLDYAKSYPTNVEVKALLTFSSGKPPQQATTQTISLVMHHSMILLPEEPMKPRYFDNRMGYFSVGMSEFGETHQVDKKRYITKWRLEPKNEDIEKFKNGELVEPKKPIVYYLDPATPMKWRPALRAGVEDWNQAFEQAGFKNAIKCLDPPTKEEDPDWHPEDARYSVIRYFASPIQNAYGPHVHDPRTGEILESDIGWFHNVMNLLRNWYFVQTAAVDPRAEKLPLPDDLMADLIQFVATHEVGHTLGLQHNMKASHAYPVDSLRSKTFTAKYGTAPSIMDYARFNYVAQPGDGAALYPKIGNYDRFAIEWGYKPILDAANQDEEKPTLNTWLKAQEKDSTIRFGRQQFRILDPYAQTEDLGDDAIKATTYGVKNLERICNKLLSATEKEGENYDLLQEMYASILGQWYREMAHVANYVGGVDRIELAFGQEGDVFTMIPKAKQKAAIKFIGDTGFDNPPAAFLNQDILRKFEATGTPQRIMNLQARLLAVMLSSSKLLRIAENEQLNPNDRNAYKLSEAMSDIKNTVWSDLKSSRVNVDIYKRNLQRQYVEYLAAKLKTRNDLRPACRSQLVLIQKELRTAIPRAVDNYTRSHLQDMYAVIEDYLNPKG